MSPFDKIIKIREVLGMSHIQKIILFVIASHLGNNDFAFPSFTTLQNECGLSRTALSENLNKLISGGYLVKLPPNKEYKSNQYHINFDVIDQYARTTSSPELLVVQDYQTSSPGLPDQYARTTRLVVQDYPKEQLKEIKRKRKTTGRSFLSHESQKQSWEIPVKPIDYKLIDEAETETEESEIGDAMFWEM